MQPKDSNNALAYRRHLFLTTSDYDKNYSDRWNRCINTPTITEKYQYMSLISAVIPNNINTVQNEVNDHILLHFEWHNYINIADKYNFDKHFNNYRDIDLAIPQGNYTGKQLLEFLGNRLRSILWSNIAPNIHPDVDEDPSHADITQLKDDKTDIIHFIDGENRLQIDFKYFTHCGNNYITKFTIEFPNLAYKLYGLDSANKEIQVFSMDPQIAIDLDKFTDYTIQLPNQPSLIWVTFIQIRCDWVNNDQNSSVLANIPVTDITKEYITFTNPQVEWTAKKMKYHEYQRMKIALSNEDGYALDIKNLPVYFEVILY